MSAGERIWASALRSASWAVSSLKEGGFGGEMETSAANPLWCSKTQGHSCFPSASRREQVPRSRQIEDKEFQLPQAGWSQQVGAPMAGSRAVTLTVVTYLTSISEELCEVGAMSPLRLRCPVRWGQPQLAEG